MLLRLTLGAVLAAVFAAGAVRAQALSYSGAVAAAVIGAIAAAAGWSWAILLVVFFVPTSALSAYGSTKKESLLRTVTVKAGARDALQVLANGGWYATAALGWIASGSPVWLAAGGGAIAAAAADSWATELGVLHGRQPRSILSRRPLATGLSGGITAVGSVAGAAGAALMAVTMLIIGWPPAVSLPAAFAGVSGMIMDSILGATVQKRLICPICAQATEQPVHSCGTITVPRGGVTWIDNDAVNALGTLTGAAVAALGFIAFR